MSTIHPTGYASSGQVLSSAGDGYTSWQNTSNSGLEITQTNGTSIYLGQAQSNNASYQTITTYPTTNITSGGYIYTEPSPTDEIKSKPSPTEEHSHNIQCRLRVEATKVISEYFCNHCEEVLFSKVISKIPKGIINKKCLSRIVKGV